MELSPTEDHEVVLNFITDHHYPYSWTVERLSLHRILELRTTKEVAGYIWFNTRSTGVIEFHVCIKPSFAGRWITRRILNQLFSIGRSSGAHSLLCLIDRPSIERTMRRLGARVIGPFALLSIEV